MQQKMLQQGMVTEAMTPDEFKKLIDASTTSGSPVLERPG